MATGPTGLTLDPTVDPGLQVLTVLQQRRYVVLIEAILGEACFQRAQVLPEIDHARLELVECVEGEAALCNIRAGSGAQLQWCHDSHRVD